MIGSLAINYLSVIILFISVLFALMIGGWYVWHRFTLFRNRLKKEVREAEEALHKSFDLLKESLGEQIKMLEKTKNRRPLTEEEEKIIRQMKKDLGDAEKFVSKEIKDIKREVGGIKRD
jgi:hypothetical protein